MDGFREFATPTIKPVKTQSDIDKQLLQKLLIEAFAAPEDATNKDIVLVIGNTGSGKSTTINYLLGCPMEVQERGAQDVIVVKPGTREYAVIGHDITNSQTLYPSVFQMPGNDYYLCDCPGFADARGPEYEITAALSTKVTINASRRIKGIVVVIEQGSMNGEGRAAGLRGIFETMQKLLSQMPASQQEVIDDKRLKDSITFIITKPGFTRLTNRPVDTRKLLEQIKNERINKKTEESQNIVSMCDLMLNSNNLFLINPLDEGQSREILLKRFNQLNLLLPQEFGLPAAENARRVLQDMLGGISAEGAELLIKLKELPQIIQTKSQTKLKEEQTYRELEQKINYPDQLSATNVDNDKVIERLKKENQERIAGKENNVESAKDKIRCLEREIANLNVTTPVVDYDETYDEKKVWGVLKQGIRTTRTFNYSGGLPILNKERQGCGEGSEFGSETKNFSAGQYTVTFTTGPKYYGTATVKVFVASNLIPENARAIAGKKDHLKALREGIGESSRDIEELAQGHERMVAQVEEMLLLKEKNAQEYKRQLLEMYGHQKDKGRIRISKLEEEISAAQTLLRKVQTALPEKKMSFTLVEKISPLLGDLISSEIKQFLNLYKGYTPLASVPTSADFPIFNYSPTSSQHSPVSGYSSVSSNSPTVSHSPVSGHSSVSNTSPALSHSRNLSGSPVSTNNSPISSNLLGYNPVLVTLNSIEQLLNQHAGTTAGEKNPFLNAEEQVLTDVRNYLCNGQWPIGHTDYCVNDRRQSVEFYPADALQQGLNLRRENYLAAAKLLVQHIGFPNKSTLLEALNRVANPIAIIQPRELLTLIKALANELKKASPNEYPYRDWKTTNWLNAMDQAEYLINQQNRLEKVVTLTKSDDYVFVQVDIPILSLTPEQQNEYLQINKLNHEPDWFKAMQIWEQSYWRVRLSSFSQQSVLDLNAALHTLPSTFIKYPGIAFYLHHHCMVFKASENIFHVVRARSSILHPYNSQETSAEKRIRERNFAQLIAVELPLSCARILRGLQNPIVGEPNIPILMATNLSPMSPIMTAALKEMKLPTETVMTAQNRNTQTDFADRYRVSDPINIQFILSNIAVNELRKDGPSPIPNSAFIDEIDPEVVKIIFRCVLNYFKCNVANQDIHHTKFINYLVTYADRIANVDKNYLRNIIPRDGSWKLPQILIAEGLVEYLEIYYGNFPAELNKNLVLSAIQKVLVAMMGGASHSTCKSGKDRTAMVLIYEDSIISYFSLYNRFPQLRDSGHERNNFIKIFAGFFISGHHQALTNSNSSGCFGLKSVGGVLPKDIYDYLYRNHREFLKCNDRLAILNRRGDMKVDNWPAWVPTSGQFFPVVRVKSRENPAAIDQVSNVGSSHVGQNNSQITPNANPFSHQQANLGSASKKLMAENEADEIKEAKERSFAELEKRNVLEAAQRVVVEETNQSLLNAGIEQSLKIPRSTSLGHYPNLFVATQAHQQFNNPFLTPTSTPQYNSRIVAPQQSQHFNNQFSTPQYSSQHNNPFLTSPSQSQLQSPNNPFLTSNPFQSGTPSSNPIKHNQQNPVQVNVHAPIQAPGAFGIFSPQTPVTTLPITAQSDDLKKLYSIWNPQPPK